MISDPEESMLLRPRVFWSSEIFLSATGTKSKLQASASAEAPALLSVKYTNTVCSGGLSFLSADLEDDSL